MTTLFLILIVVVILTCIWLNNISARIGVPTLLAFIVLGIVFGNVGASSFLPARPLIRTLWAMALKARKKISTSIGPRIIFSMSGKAISTTATAKTPYMHQKVRL